MNGGYSKVEHWKVFELVSSMDSSSKPVNDKRIVIPKFQRSLVWQKDREIKFIDSLKRGYPFGSLLLYRRGGSGPLEEYSLIDGLQRSNTLKRYYQHPNEYFSEADVSTELCRLVLDFGHKPLTDENLAAAQHAIAQWVKGKRGFEETDGYSSYNLVVDGLKPVVDLPFAPAEMAFESLMMSLASFLQGWKKKSDISQVDIPIMIYHGPEEDLPEIFERINSSGIQLSKYQIFAATWASHTCDFTDKEITHFIEARYEVAKQEGLVLEGTDDVPEEDEGYSVFEYLFGLGKVLSSRYPQLFRRLVPSRMGDTDSVGFNIATACLGLPLSDMAKLPKRIDEVGAGVLTERLFEAIDIVDQWLEPFIGLKANSRKNASIAHSELQIVSLIALVYKLKFEEPGWPEVAPTLKVTLPQWYLHDIITQNWKGSGDKKVDESVSKKKESRYLKVLRRQQWEAALDEWFHNQLEDTTVDRKPIPPDTILFLKFVYTHSITNFVNHAVELEVDHLMPVSRLKSAGKAVAINSVGNLALIDKSLNRGKGNMTIAEHILQSENDPTKSAEDVETMVEKYNHWLFEDPQKIAIPKGENGVDELSPQFFESFIAGRFAVLKERFFAANKIPD